MPTPPLDSIICPACHGKNPADAVFCGNPSCHKALGEFDYVLEKLAEKATPLERLADKITRFTGHPHFVTVHVLWFFVWVIVNSGVIAFFSVFDNYPYSLLGIILSIEAILITSFVLISQNRENTYSEKRAELDYEVNVKSYRKLNELQDVLEDLVARVDALEARLQASEGRDGHKP
jgi:uncharacterized membrane protein